VPQFPEIAAEELLHNVWRGASEKGIPYPVDPAKIAEQLGLKVYAAGLDETVSGMLVKRPAQDPEIFLNGSDSKNRQRFTCAHELGHYVKRSNGQIWSTEGWEYIDLRSPLSSTGESPDEVWANQFAAALLMPKQEVKKLHKSLAPATMAFEFGVSTDAMNFRLKNLGLV
jgi:Zn-dependent peptidase ImmA (M78 family)